MKGSCNCGDVQYSTEDNVKAVVNCHCKLCRKMNGSAFSTYVVVPESEFHLKHGSLNRVKVADSASKSYCSNCGTPIFNDNPKFQGLIMLYLGSIDAGKLPQPQVNIYCESQIKWVHQLASLNSFDKGLQ
jgi:hypothetical protein